MNEAPRRQVSTWNIANVLTMGRIAVVPFFGAALLVHDGQSSRWRIFAWCLFALASFTDRVDGQLARSRDLVTEFGKLMDPIADKALMGMAFIGLSIIHVLPWWVTIVILVREIGITLLRFVVIKYGVMPASRGGKLKTALQAFAAGLFILPLPFWALAFAWVLMAAAIVVTVVTGVDYLYKAAALRRETLATR